LDGASAPGRIQPKTPNVGALLEYFSFLILEIKKTTRANRQQVFDFHRATDIRGFCNYRLVLFRVRFFVANPIGT